MDAEKKNNSADVNVFFDTKETEILKDDEQLLEKGESVGMKSLEWSLEFLTKSISFLRGRPMSSMSIYALHVWIGSQNSTFISRIPIHSKIRNELLNCLIHPIHELVSNLKRNEFYLMALNSENNVVLNDGANKTYFKDRSDAVKIPLMSGCLFDFNFIMNNIRLLYNYIVFGSRSDIEKLYVRNHSRNCRNSVRDDSIHNDIDVTISESSTVLCIKLCSLLIFHWLLHNVLSNCLYNQNGPISIISFNILIEKISPFFPIYNEYSSKLHNEVVYYYDCIWKIWINLNSINTGTNISGNINCYLNNGNDNNILADYLNKYPKESEEFMGLLKQIYTKYPLDDLLYLLSDFVSALNTDFDSDQVNNNLYGTKNVGTDNCEKDLPFVRPDLETNPRDDHLPIEADPQEPFNSVFELTGFIRASSICREFSQLLRPKEKFNKNVVNNVRNILNYCLKNNIADKKYITNTEFEKYFCKQNRTSASVDEDPGFVIDREEFMQESHGMQKMVMEEEDLDENCEEPKTGIEERAERDRQGLKGKVNTEVKKDSDEMELLRKKNEGMCLLTDENSGDMDNMDSEPENSGDNGQTVKVGGINFYSNNEKSSRKISVRGISESSESGNSSEESNGSESLNIAYSDLGLTSNPRLNSSSGQKKEATGKIQKSDCESEYIVKIKEKRGSKSRNCSITSSKQGPTLRPRIKTAETKDGNDKDNMFTPKRRNLGLSRSSDCHFSGNNKRSVERNRGSCPYNKTNSDTGTVNVTSSTDCNNRNGIPNQSRQYRRWSEEETNLLVNGVNKFGLGKWRLILVTAKLTSRDEVGLKDRWRNLVKGGHVVWDQKSKMYNLVKQ